MKKTTTKSDRVRNWRLMDGVVVAVVIVVIISTSLGSVVKAEGTNGGHDPTRHLLWESKRREGRDEMLAQQTCTDTSQIIVQRDDDRPPKIPTYDTTHRRPPRRDRRPHRRRQMPLEQWLINRSKQGSLTIEVGGHHAESLSMTPLHRRPWRNEPHGRSLHPPKALTMTEASPPTTTNTTETILSRDHNTTTNKLSGSSLGNRQQQRRIRRLVGRPRLPLSQPDPTVELTVSISPISLLRLLHIMGVATAGALGAFGATLRLVAPMIVARRLISSIGYICYDYYNGRYIRTTYHKRLRNLEDLEIPSALRACGRMGAQLFVMVVVGGMTRMLLQAAPCGLPDLACRYWFGSVWVGSVLLAGSSIERWVREWCLRSRGNMYMFSHSLTSLIIIHR